jgi:hypothetical protein
MRLYLGVPGVMMALEVTSSIASSGMYKKYELMNNFYNDNVRLKYGEIKLEILIL